MVNTTDRVWIEDGILCTKFSSELSLELILDIQKQMLELIEKNNIKVVPAIIDVGEINDTSMKLHFSDLGKFFTTTNDTLKHESGVWLVGAKGSTRKMGVMISTMFMNG